MSDVTARELIEALRAVGTDLCDEAAHELEKSALKLPRWRKVDDEPPPPHERVLTLMKHGMISGCYDPESGTFGSYYWRHMEWFATYWMPLPELPQ